MVRKEDKKEKDLKKKLEKSVEWKDKLNLKLE